MILREIPVEFSSVQYSYKNYSSLFKYDAYSIVSNSYSIIISASFQFFQRFYL